MCKGRGKNLHIHLLVYVWRNHGRIYGRIYRKLLLEAVWGWVKTGWFESKDERETFHCVYFYTFWVFNSGHIKKKKIKTIPKPSDQGSRTATDSSTTALFCPRSPLHACDPGWGLYCVLEHSHHPMAARQPGGHRDLHFGVLQTARSRGRGPQVRTALRGKSLGCQKPSAGLSTSL